MRCEGCAENVAGIQPCARCLLVEEADSESISLGFGGLVFGAHDLSPAAGQHDRAADRDIGLDPFGVGPLHDLIDARTHRRVLGDRIVLAAFLG